MSENLAVCGLILVLHRPLRGQQPFEAGAISFVAVTDPTVKRTSVAVEDGTLMLAVGAPVSSGFQTTFRPENFEHVPRAD